MKNRFCLIVPVVFGLLFLQTSLSLADDPLTVGPDVYKLKFENDRVRVMEIAFVPGAKIATHSHPDHTATFVTAGTLKLTYPDGTSKDISGNPGDTIFIPAETHAAENIGTTEVKGIVVELKESRPAPAE